MAVMHERSSETTCSLASGHEKRTRDFLLLFAALTVWLTLLLGQRGLNEPDEGRYSNIALNFLRPGADLWEPRMSGFAHYDKPPLVYWTTALSFKFFGQNEIAARLPSVFGALLALAGVGWAARRLYSKEVAWWAMLVCGTMGQFWLLARFLTPDMLLTGWCTLAIAAAIECRHREGSWKWWFVSLVFWTLAWWTKATPALIPLLGLTVGTIAMKDAAGKKSLRPLFLLTGILVLGSAWYVRMIHQHGELVDFFFVRELKGRVTGHIEGRRGPIYFYLLLSLMAWLPWWPLALRAALVQRKNSPFTWSNFWQGIGLEGWIVLVGIVVFSCISSKLPTYTLPLAPWVALLFAKLIVQYRETIPPATFRRWTFASSGIFGAVVLSALVATPRFESGLGLNSSLREVAETVQQNGGRVIYADKYWPDLEFYFGENVHYVILEDGFYWNHIHQRQTDTGIIPSLGETRFCTAENWRDSVRKQGTNDVWLVRYLKTKTSPFSNVSTNTRSAKIVGDFLLEPLSSKP